MPFRAHFTVNHGCDFARTIVCIATQSIARSDRLCQSEINVFEQLRRGPAVTVEFGEDKSMKSVVYGRGNLRRDEPMPLGIHQEDAGGGVEFAQILRDHELF